MAIMAMPQNLLRSAKIGWRSADRMWRLAGDTASDFNHYTKRMTLGAIYGAVLGALIMQSLQSGMAMVGVDTPFQNVVVGLVLVIAVWVDILYRKRMGLTK